jgi:hypothetical protein
MATFEEKGWDAGMSAEIGIEFGCTKVVQVT